MSERAPRRGGRLRRFAVRLCVVLAVLALLLRVAFALAIVPVLTALAAGQGLELEIDRLGSRWHDGVLELDRLTLRAADAPEDAAPLLELDYLLFDADMSALLTGTPRVHRLELDGLRAELVREADGRWRLPTPSTEVDDEPRDPEDDAPDEDDVAPDPEAAPFPLRLPVEVGAVLLQQVRLTVRDLSRAEPFERKLALELRVEDLGLEDRPARAELFAVGPGWMDLLLTQLEANPTADGGLALDGRFELSGLHPDRLAPLLEGTGVEPRARTMAGRGELTARATPLDAGRPRGPLSLELAVEQAGLEVDLERALGLDALRLTVPRWSAAAIEGARLSVEGPTARAVREPDGALAVLGLVFPPPADGSEPRPEPEPEPDTDRSTTPAGGPTLRDAGVTVTGGRFAISDRAAPEGPLELAVELSEISLTGLSWPIRKDSPPGELRAALSMPGTLDALTLDGRVDPRPGGLSLSMTLGAEGVSARGSRPYLTAAGLASSLDGGRVDLSLEADVSREDEGARVRAVARGLALEDGSGRLVDLGTLTVEDLFLADAGGLRLGRVAVEEVRLDVERRADGDLAVAGLRLPGEPGASPFTLGIAAQELSLTDLDLTDRASAPATLRARGAIDGLVERLSLDGLLSLPEGGLLATLEFGAEGLAPTGLEGLLADLRLESELVAATASGRLELRRGEAVEDGALAVELTEVALQDRGSELFALDRVSLGASDLTQRAFGPVELEGLRLAVDRDERGRLGLLGLREAAPEPTVTAAPAIDTTVDVEGFADAEPDDAGEAEGTRDQERSTDAPTEVAAVPPATGADGPAAASGDGSRATDASRAGEGPRAEEGAAGAVAAETPAADAGGPLPIPALTSAGVRLTDVRVTYDDRTTAEARRDVWSLAAEVGALRLGPEALPGELSLDLRLDDSASISVVAELLGDPEALRLDGRVDGRIADGAALDPILPPGVTCTLEDGRLAGALTLAVVAGEEGGRAFELALEDVALADRGGEREHLGLTRAELTAPRLDPGAARLAIETLRVEGLTAEAALDPDGTVHALGLALGPRPTDAGRAPARPAPDAEGSGPGGGALPRPLPDRLPTITLATLELELERLRLVDRAQGEDAEPLVVSGRLYNERPWRLLDDRPEELPPIVARLEAAAAPVLGAAELVLTLEPFVDPPHLALEVDLSGLSGEGLERAFPVAAARLEAGDLHDGRLTAGLDLVLDVRRRHPLAIDLRDGFGAVLELARLELVDAERDERWLGLSSLRVDVQRVRPATGDVHVAAVEFQEPFARARVRDEALEFLSVRLPMAAGTAPVEGPDGAAAATEDAAGEGSGAALGQGEDPAGPGGAPEDPVQQVAAGAGGNAADAAGTPLAPEAGSGAARPEFRVDQLLVTGLDVEFTDEDAEPPVRVPLEDLDLELRNFTTRADSATPLTFSALVTAGDVELPKRTRTRGGLIGGLAEAAVAGITGAKREVELEPRPLFRELGASGRLDLSSRPEGWIRFHTVGFELLALRGLARQSGIEIGGGVLDTNVRVDLEGDEGLEIESTTVFDDLSLSEPPGGPISRILKLPAPLDTVLFLLRDQSGEVRLPVDVRVSEEGLTLGRLTRAVTEAMASVISSAVAGSPLRVAGGITGLVGLGPDDTRDDDPIESSADYAPGATLLPDDGLAVLDRALDSLREDDALQLVVEAQLGAEDLLHVERLANPSDEETRALARRLEERRADLDRRRVEQAAEARALVRVGDPSTDDRLGELRALETRIGLLERALDDLYGRLRPGSERRAPRRTREAALRLGELRLEAVLARLDEVGAGRLVDRLDLRPARLPREQPEPRGSLRLSLVRRR